VPVGSDIYEVTKDEDGVVDTLTHHGYVFVPLVTTDE
jgi:hypothetical protein